MGGSTVFMFIVLHNKGIASGTKTNFTTMPTVVKSSDIAELSSLLPGHNLGLK